MTRWFANFHGLAGLRGAGPALGLASALGLAVSALHAQTLPPPNTIAFSNSLYVAYDADPLGYAPITVLFGGGSVTGVTVDYDVDLAQPNTAIPGLDYVLTPGRLILSDTQPVNAFVVTILNNPAATGDRSVFLKLVNATGGAVLGLAQAELRIRQGLPPVPLAAGGFSFTRPFYYITELEGLGNRDFFIPNPIDNRRCVPGALITVNRTNGLVGRVWVDWVATDDATGFPVDAGSLVFDDGQTSTNFFIYGPLLGGLPFPITSNTDATVTLQLSNPRPDPLENAELIQPTLDPFGATASLTIVGVLNRPSSFSIESLHYRVDEYPTLNNGQITIFVALPGGGTGIPPDGQTWCNVEWGLSIWVPPAVALDEGSDYATPGVDFVTGTAHLVFGALDQVLTITIPIQQDSLVEFNEDLFVQFTRPLGAGLSVR